MALLFLLGSGVSGDADMPGVAEISAAIRSGEGVFLGDDALFHFNPENPNYERLRPAAEPGAAVVWVLPAGLIAEEVRALVSVSAPNGLELRANAGGALSR